jgi:hypothetical protein
MESPRRVLSLQPSSLPLTMWIARVFEQRACTFSLCHYGQTQLETRTSTSRRRRFAADLKLPGCVAQQHFKVPSTRVVATHCSSCQEQGYRDFSPQSPAFHVQKPSSLMCARCCVPCCLVARRPSAVAVDACPCASAMRECRCATEYRHIIECSLLLVVVLLSFFVVMSCYATAPWMVTSHAACGIIPWLPSSCMHELSCGH